MPGTIIREKTQRVARSLPTETGTLFLAGVAEKGRVGLAEFARNMDEFVLRCGSRISTSLAYDMAEGFFQEGGSKLYFSRIAGPAPVKASRNLLDGVAAISLVVKAKSEGTWGNAYTVAVIAGDAAGEFKLQFGGGPAGYLGETSPSFVDQNAAVEWSKAHDLFEITLGVSANDPAVVAAAALTGGTDDNANISDATAATALTAFKKDLGPGQVAYAGRTTAVAHGQLRDHGKANNRRPLYDHPDTTSKATLIATVAAIKALGADVNIGALFGPWVTLPGLVPGASPRPIPASAVVAGVIARNDSQGLSPNKPAAGDLGVFRYVVDTRVVTFTDQDYEDLNDAGVNMIRNRAGDLKVFGYRSVSNKVTDPLGWQFGNQRLYMAIAAQADNILERFALREIDGRKLLFKELQGQLKAMLDTFGDSLYGRTSDERYYVDVDTVNTPATIAAGEIHAAIELTMSPMGEKVILDIIKRQITA